MILKHCRIELLERLDERKVPADQPRKRRRNEIGLICEERERERDFGGCSSPSCMSGPKGRLPLGNFPAPFGATFPPSGGEQKKRKQTEKKRRENIKEAVRREKEIEKEKKN